jgi:Domain of unknown function (DUF4410)
MKSLGHGTAYLLALVVIAGCSSTKISDRKVVVNEKVPRPDHIWVYDFASSAAEIPPGSALAGQVSEPSTPPTAEQLEAGREAGAEVAKALVEDIRAMGLPAERGSIQTKPQINDLVIRGYLLSIEEGSAAKRVAIGFGAGASELKLAVEGFRMTATGLQKLGSGSVDSGGSKSPGAAMGVVGLIATANPAGLIIGTGVKAYGEVSGSSKVEGRAKAAAAEIAEAIKPRFQQQGWID